MEAAAGGAMFDDAMATEGWKLQAPPSCSERMLGGTEEPLQDWVVEPDCTLSGSESDGVLHGVDPNEVFPCGALADALSDGDSSASDESAGRRTGSTVTVATTPSAPPTVYQVVYDIGGVGGATSEAGRENVISIELDGWSSQLLLSDSCVVSELPPVSSAAAAGPSWSEDALSAALQLTEEEQRLLNQEGVSLPNNLPLTKAEERLLKKVRRKIRNKQSAQDSRRRRKEYIDGLESRATACSAQNRELQKTVEKLERHNMSLLKQLQQLQSLIRQTVSKGAQTSTCLLIILVSLSLIILPSLSPFSRSEADDYKPTGVISRNILTDPAASQPAADDVVPPQPADSSQSGPPEGGATALDPIEKPGNTTLAGAEGENNQSGDEPAAVAVAADRRAAQQRGGDPGKPAHADEM